MTWTLGLHRGSLGIPQQSSCQGKASGASRRSWLVWYGSSQTTGYSPSLSNWLEYGVYYWGYIGITEKKMEITIMGYIGFRV